MRRLIALSLLLALAACGGSTPTNPPPPPPPPAPGPPASLTVQAGDGQQAEPGKPLPVRPSVLVKDASGRAVPGVSVSFAVDSGGGSVSPASATTGSDGIAATDWTLGPAEGSGVLLATAAGLPAARLRATGRFALVTLLSGATVPSTGGTVTYAKAGDPLSGLSIIVPDSTYPTATSFTVAAVPALQVQLPADVKQLGPAFLVSDGKGFADMPMALVLPLHAGGDSVIAAFFYDPSSGTMENVPLAARDDSSITVVSKHFSADQLLITGGGAGLRAALRMPGAAAPAPAFGQIYIIGVVTTPAALNQFMITGFRPGVDDWEFSNYGTFAAMGGQCAGMSVTAMYYYYRFRPSAQPLFHQYDTFKSVEYDNPQGERLTGTVQRDMSWTKSTAWLQIIQNFAARSRISYDQLVYQSLALTIKVTHLPQYLALRGPSGGHAVVAYAMDNGVIRFADPNYPGNTTRVINYVNGGFTPVSLSLTAGGSSDLMPFIHMLGNSALVSMAVLGQRWNEFLQKHVGQPYFPPSIQREMFDPILSQWVPLPANDSIATTGRVLAFRSFCPGCRPFRIIPPVNRATTRLKDTTDTELGNDGADTDTAAVMTLGPGKSAFRVSFESFYLDSVQSKLGIVDQRYITITGAPFIIAPSGVTDTVNAKLNFTATNSGLAQADWTFKWTFSDGTAPVTKLGDSTITHQWKTAGTFTLKAELRDSRGKLVASDQGPVIIKVPEFAWQLTSATLSASQLPAGGIGSLKADTTIYNAFTSFVGDLQTAPTNWLFYLANRNGCQLLVLEQFPPGQFMPVFDNSFPGPIRALIGATTGESCVSQNYVTSLTMGTLGSGTLVGSVVDNSPTDTVEMPGGSINATMNGKSLQGTFTWLARFSTGLGVYTFNFQATQVVP